MERKNIRIYQDFLISLANNGPYYRLGKTFATEENFYYYDVGTGKILECEYNVFLILKHLETANSVANLGDLQLSEDELLSALEELRTAVQKENIMQAPPLDKFVGPHVEGLEYLVKNQLQQLTLEVTQKCNLRCDYCVYHSDNTKFRDFEQSTPNMDFETAKKALDYALVHSHKADDFSLTFYGGEPLLQYDLIKQCVEYFEAHKTDIPILYSMTTNLTLMTEEKASFFASIPNFAIVCSIDGDKETHDEHRKTIDGKGSFDKAMQGLEILVNAYGPKNRGNILINMVVSEPYTNDKFDRIQNFLEMCPYIYDDTVVMYSYVDHGVPDYENVPDASIKDNEDMSKWIPIQTWAEERSHQNPRSSLFTKYNSNRDLARVHKRRLSKKPIGNYFFNGCCVPGARRIYVTTEGKFKICEQIGESPYIGHVDTGIDLEAIQQKYIQEYAKKSKLNCSQCWAVHLCGICYARCYGKDGINPRAKEIKCGNQLKLAEHDLIEYHRTIERNPLELEILNSIV